PTRFCSWPSPSPQAQTLCPPPAGLARAVGRDDCSEDIAVLLSGITCPCYTGIPSRVRSRQYCCPSLSASSHIAFHKSSSASLPACRAHALLQNPPLVDSLCAGQSARLLFQHLPVILPCFRIRVIY